jgi:hypothetical protein
MQTLSSQSIEAEILILTTEEECVTQIDVRKGRDLGEEVTIGVNGMRWASGQFQPPACPLDFLTLVRVRPNLFLAEWSHGRSLSPAFLCGQEGFLTALRRLVPVLPAPGQHQMHRRHGHPQLTADGAEAQSFLLERHALVCAFMQRSWATKSHAPWA